LLLHGFPSPSSPRSLVCFGSGPGFSDLDLSPSHAQNFLKKRTSHVFFLHIKPVSLYENKGLFAFILSSVPLFYPDTPSAISCFFFPFQLDPPPFWASLILMIVLFWLNNSAQALCCCPFFLQVVCVLPAKESPRVS